MGAEDKFSGRARMEEKTGFTDMKNNFTATKSNFTDTFYFYRHRGC